MRQRLFKATAAVLILLLVVAVGGYVYLRRSLPAVNGTVEVPGVTAPVDIIRDADAIPHIFAATRLDALFGLGYAHAQDRLWQMEFQRRIGEGRLSEIFGQVTVPEDRFLRTVGFARAARAAWDRLPADTRSDITSYIGGINAFVATHHGSALPPEFTLLRFEPQPWTGEDVLVWVKMMSWDLSANYSIEMMRHDIAARIGSDRLADLFPPYPANGLTVLGDLASPGAVVSNGLPPGRQSAVDTGNWSLLLARGLGQPASIVRSFLLETQTEALGSNNWVVDGTISASGKPLLANDPHLGTHVPSLWYLAHMSAGDFDIIGATLPGTPAVAIGRNRFIAWGETNVAADVEDLYQERLDATGTTAEYRGSQEPLRMIEESIGVKGGAPVTVDVRITRHGPLVSDALNASNAEAKTEPKAPTLEPLAFRWTALDDEDETIVAFLRLNQARNWSDFTAALQHFAAPSQNFVYADVDGHIGYYVPGHIPIRAHGDGSRPAEGWTGESEWTGWIPFDELPHTYDPPSHFIVTANNRPIAGDYPYLIALEYPNPYRAQRITDLIQQRSGKLGPDDFRTIQADTFSPHASQILPLLLKHVHPLDAADKSALDLVKRWNFDARGDSAATAIFEAWFQRLAPALVGDDLGEILTPLYARRFSFVTRFVMSLLEPEVVSGFSRTSANTWCDDGRTAEHETCDDEVSKALHDGVAMLTQQLGADQTRWRWDGVHRAIFPHQGLDTVPGLRFFLSRSMPNGGDWSAVNVGPVDVEHLFEQHEVPGYRQIIDLSPANDSRFLDAVGESGHFLSPHYVDFLQDWHDVRHRRMRMDRADIERGATGQLHLTPK